MGENSLQSESWQSGLDLLGLAEEARGTFNGRALSIAPRRKRKPLATRMAEIASSSKEKPLIIEGSSAEIFALLEEMSRDERKRIEDIGLITMAYSLHNYALDGRDDQVLDFLARAYPEAKLLVADYTLKDHDQATIVDAISSGFERETLARKGLDTFLHEHRVYTAEQLFDLFEQHYEMVDQHALSPFRAAYLGRVPKASIGTLRPQEAVQITKLTSLPLT